MGNKIPKTTGIFDDVDHPKNRGVTYWAERNGPLVDHISQVSRCVVFGAGQKNCMLFFEYFKIGCMYLNNFFLIWKVWSGAMLVTIFHTIKSITAFSVTKKPKKSWAESWQHYLYWTTLELARNGLRVIQLSLGSKRKELISGEFVMGQMQASNVSSSGLLCHVGCYIYRPASSVVFFIFLSFFAMYSR